MRIGLSGGGTTTDRLVQQAVEAEADGFTSLWYPSAILGDPLVAMAMAGRATTSIELGTAVLQTYTCHPVLQANRAASTAAAMGRPGLTLGLGPSHQLVIEGAYGLSYDGVGAHTEEYVTVLSTLLRGEGVKLDGEHFRVHIPIDQRAAATRERDGVRRWPLDCSESPVSSPTERSSGWEAPRPSRRTSRP